ncbi:MAG: PAS domain-containing protein [Syntrophaceae bacterium]
MSTKPTYEELEKRVMVLERESERRRKTKGALRKYDLFLSAVEDPMAYIDKNSVYRAINEAFLRIFNKTRPEIVGHPVGELLGKEIFEKKIKRSLDQCMAGRESYSEDWIEHPSRGRRYMILAFNPFFEEDGTISGIAVVARDITKRKLAEEALEKTTRELMARNEIDRIFLASPGEHTCAQILEMMLLNTRSSHGAFEFRDQAGQWATLSMGNPSSDGPVSLLQGTLLSDEEWAYVHANSPLIKQVFPLQTAFRGTGTPDSVHHGVVAPVIFQDEIMATLVLVRPGRAFSDEEYAFLEHLSNHMAPILHARLHRIRREIERTLFHQELQKARDDLEKVVLQRTAELLDANEQLKKEIEVRKRMEQALRQSEEMLRAQYRGIPLPTFTWKRAGQDFVLVDYNRATEDFTRGLIAKFLGKTSSEVYRDRPDIIQDISSSYELRHSSRRVISYRMFTTEEEKFVALTSAYVPPDMVLVHMEDITESRRSQEKLKRSEKNLRILSSQLMDAKEEERKRISQELHDSVGQYLTSIKFSMENIIGQMERGSSSLSLKSLKDSIPIIQATIEEVRSISMDLRPSTLDDLGILATVSWFCREFHSVYSDITINQNIALQESDVPEHLKIIIFRIIQEALNNVAKHSRADMVDISLFRRDTTIDLTISDNGIGFDVRKALMSEDYSKGLGLASMEERADISGGCFTIDSVPGLGTLIMTTWKTS